MSVKIDYLNFCEKHMTIFAEKKKKKKDRWIQITNQVNVLVVSESVVCGWPLINVWGGMAGVFGYQWWIQITNQVNVLVVSESGVRGWPLISVWGGMAGVFGYQFLT